MSVAKLNVARARDLLGDFDFRGLFNELGWSNPTAKRRESFMAGEAALTRTAIAELSGIVVYEVASDTGGIPDRKTQAVASRETAKTSHEHVLVFVDEDRTQSVWYWVKREDGKRQPREHYYFKGQPGDLFLSKIAALVVDLSELDERGHLPLVSAADKVKRALDVERVIKRFFKDYDDLRVEFTKLIVGIPDENDRRWYASVLLNRLMFIYFLQRRFFLDGGDGRYLENKLDASKKRGEDRYYSEFLKTLFFEAFAKPKEKRSAEALRLTGEIRYLNGGLFLPHGLEKKYKIAVPDKAFDSLYNLFARYSWNLNDIPGEEDNDINPDVLGYIFEKYINQKEFGAYYTRPEITEYLCEQTIHRLILDRINEPAIEGLPAGREYESVPELLVRLDKQTARRLLHTLLPDLTILDPAVGSGAFLVAALKTLLTVYSAVVGWLQFNDKAWLEEWIRGKKTTAGRIQYMIKKAIITDNLYGVDIMEEATEIAKLRLFMTLVASAHTVEELEPLPNIDFNILAGNSLIGLMRVEDSDVDDSSRLLDVGDNYQKLLTTRNLKVEQIKHLDGYVEDQEFIRDEINNIEKPIIDQLDQVLLRQMGDLGVKVEEATWDEKKNALGKPNKRTLTTKDIRKLEPFHWGFEFDQILNLKGGFDAIITNPPWETLKPIAREFCYEHSEQVNRRGNTAKEFEAILQGLLEDPRIREGYLKYLSKFPHQSAYFRSAREYSNQTAEVGGKKTGSDVNLYKLFTERAFHLLRHGGLCGIVIPSGIYSDLGTTGLRKMLFSQANVTGLFTFENRKEIFEGVHRSFKFSLLSYKKGSHTTRFPAAFMRHNVSDLHQFPRAVGMWITLDTVKSLSPDTLSVVEFQSPLDAQISEKLLAFPMLGDDLEDAWQLKLTREFDMTNDASLFESESSSRRLVLFEGKMIWHYKDDYAAPRYYVDEGRGREAILGRRPDHGQILDYQQYRFAYRSITGNTNQRTMVCSILPQNVFCGNSLGVSKRVGLKLSDSELLFANALLSSFVVDYSLRQRVATQLNMFFVYQIRVPRLSVEDANFAQVVRRCARLICTSPEFADLWNQVDAEIGLDSITESSGLKESRWNTSSGTIEESTRSKLRAELDALVAHLYGLNEEEFTHVLSTFPLVGEPTKIAAINEFRRFQRGGLT